MGAKPGDPVEKGDKTVEEKLGTEACKRVGMTEEQMNIRLRDIMRSASARFDRPDQDPPGDGKEGRVLSDDDWQKIAKASEVRTKWKYNPAGPFTCCCCFP